MQLQVAPTETVVVGGGPAGLTAAGYLARSGRSVTVLERAAALGGRAATQLHDGYAFNRGAHALYTGGAASAVLRDLGVTYAAGIPKEVFALQHGTLYRYPADPLAFLRTDLFDAGDKLEFARLSGALLTLDPRRLAHTSIREWIEGTVRRPQVRGLLTALAGSFVYSTALDLISAEVYVDKLQRALKHPIHYVHGGWQTLVDGLRRVATEAGARVTCGVRVEGVAYEGQRVRGVRLRDGALVPAEAVVLATSPHEAARLVDGAPGAALRRAVDALLPGHLACLDVALCRLPDPRHGIVQHLEQPLFLTTQSLYARVAPPGGALVQVFKQLDPRCPADPQGDQRDMEAFLDAVQPGWREAVVRRVSLPRIEAAGALPTAGAGGVAGRPDPRVPGLDRLYLAGDWVGPEGFLIDASLASARAAARLVIQEAPRSVARGQWSVVGGRGTGVRGSAPAPASSRFWPRT